jgi:DNA-binding MarR family transcriptional regulator
MKASLQANRQQGGTRSKGKSSQRKRMPKESNGAQLRLDARMALHRTRDLLFRCEDRVVNEFGLTAEQYTVLLAMKHLDDPIRPTDISRWVDHKVHTVSMIVDRMVRAGLLERVRDLPDRREVRLTITKRGEKALQPAGEAASRLIAEILSPLSYEDTETLVRLLQTVRDRAEQHLVSRNGNSGRDR